MFLFDKKTQSVGLRFKILKIIEQQLSLPIIPEKVSNVQRTTTPIPIKRPSESNENQEDSPQRYRLQKQVIIALGNAQNARENSKNQQIKQKRSSTPLPKISKASELNSMSVKQIRNEAFSMAKRAKSARNPKFDLSAIIKDKDAFADQYFKELKRIGR